MFFAPNGMAWDLKTLGQECVEAGAAVTYLDSTPMPMLVRSPFPGCLIPVRCTSPFSKVLRSHRVTIMTSLYEDNRSGKI